MTKSWPSKVYPVGMEAITSKKIRYYKEKTKGIFEIAKLKRSEQWGRDIRALTSEYLLSFISTPKGEK